MSIKISLIGAPRSGKDEIATFLIKNKDFSRLAFADKIKDMYFKESNITEDYFNSVKGLPEETLIRNSIWAYSDTMRKKFGKSYFIDPVVQDIISLNGNVVVSDVRTKDELDEMVKLGFKMVIIVRDFKPSILEPHFFPGSRLRFLDIMGFPVFWNYSDSLETAHDDFEKFYNCIILK